ncbi:response regulator [Paenibacillus sp. J2TS4]|uniref:response regulator n=1 Tax=Paenibacillus sp. J2TS4 TaxID=2807194 RepID=UPI001B144490|nr:response regulator [Paenibacillus sp. J2TS4]GIP33033.1 DNA-binding response regulator [Paenibacillus sp. J2TS4]
METRISMCVLDDIKSVIDGITLGIPWSDHGIEIVGTAMDGEEGLRMVQELEPDILLTDIRMPLLDGLELTRIMMQSNPSCKVILLSGYSEFSYAQQAIRLGAFDYVSKPFSIEDIVEVVLKAVEEIELERSHHRRIYEMEARVRESMPILRQEYFNLLIRYSSDEESIGKRWDFLDIGLDPENFIIMAVEVDHFAKTVQSMPISEVELTRFALQNILEETLSAYTRSIVFRESMNRQVAIFNSTSRLNPGEMAELCRQHCAEYMRHTVSIGVSSKVSTIAELPRAYEQAVSALSYNFYTGGNGVFLFGDLGSTDRYLRICSADQEGELLFALRSGNQELTLELLHQILHSFDSMQPLPDPQRLIRLYEELAGRMLRVLEEKLSHDELRGLEAEVEKLRKKGWGSLQELQQYLQQLCKQGCILQEKHRRSEAEQVIHKAVQYIKGHLHLDLSVIDCARQVHLSGSYFSNLFKKVTGQTFLQFVTNERIERAKMMLLEEKQVQEIAGLLGYEDRRYFSEVFKKHSGMTPSEFKTAYLGKKE